MGAGLSSLKNSHAEERGVQPIAELLGTTIANSAYHGTRLDVEHVTETVDNFITGMENRGELTVIRLLLIRYFFS